MGGGGKNGFPFFLWALIVGGKKFFIKGLFLGDLPKGIPNFFKGIGWSNFKLEKRPAQDGRFVF